jgi:hypothetical protein
MDTCLLSARTAAVSAATLLCVLRTICAPDAMVVVCTPGVKDVRTGDG